MPPPRAELFTHVDGPMLTPRALHRSSLPLALCLVVGLATVAAHAADRFSSTKFHARPDSTTRAASGAAVAPLGRTYHNGGTLVCVECHGNGSKTSATRFASMERRSSLRSEDALDTCLGCHDGKIGIPDVVGDDVNNLRARSAGRFEAPGRRNPHGHDLAYGLGEQVGTSAVCSRCHSGGMATASVTCVDCHDPHGNGRPRNLRFASDPAATPQLGLLVSPLASGLERYESDNVAFGTLDSEQLREASAVCVDCHHAMSGAMHVDPNHDGLHEMHPTYDSEHGATNVIRQGASKGTSDPGHWERGAGSGFVGAERVRIVTRGADSYARARVVNAATNGVFCLSCHRAHGSDQPFGLVWTAARGSGPAGCDQCHGTTEVATAALR